MQTAEQLFNDNVRYNRSLAKSMTRPKHRVAPRLKGWCSTVKVAIIVTPDEVIKKLEEHGLDITRRTLLRWEGEGLIPKPERGSYGQGGGKWTNYPDETIPEALTVSILKDVYRLKHSEIAEARKAYNEGKLAYYSTTWGDTLQSIKRDGYRRDISTYFVAMQKHAENTVCEELGAYGDETAVSMRILEAWAFLDTKMRKGELPRDMPLSEVLRVLKDMKPNDS